MRSRLLLLAALVLIDWSLFHLMVSIVEAVKISSGMYTLPFSAEVAFAVGGLLVVVGTPVCGWRCLRRVDDPSVVPQARIIRH